MERNTYLTRNLKLYGEAAQYDAEAKKILADKGLLARILQVTVKELKRYGTSEIERFIEAVEVSEPIAIAEKETQSFMPAITGMNTEDADPENGTIRYDVKFYVLISEKQRLKILINMEVQREYYVGYDLMPRGIFYCCRTITGQKNVEFRGENYGGIKKTYGIWLNLNAPRAEADSIFCVELKPQVLEGSPDPESHRYDLMNVTMVGLNKDSYKNRKTELHGFLGTIFSEKLKPDEKIRILKEAYGVEPTEEVKEGMEMYGSLGMSLYEDGVREGMQRQQGNTLRETARADAEKTRAEAAETREAMEKKRAEAAETREAMEKTRADAEKIRADEAEKEVMRLRGLLGLA